MQETADLARTRSGLGDVWVTGANWTSGQDAQDTPTLCTYETGGLGFDRSYGGVVNLILRLK